MKKAPIVSVAISTLAVMGTLFFLIHPAQAFENPTWGTTEIPVIMRQLALKGIRVDSPGSSVSSLLACGPRWIFTSAFQVFAYENGTVKNLTERVASTGASSHSFPSIACSGQGVAYWLYQDDQGFYVHAYDGQTVSTVPMNVAGWSYPNFFMSLAEQTIQGQIVFVRSGGPNLWLFDGSNVTTVSVVTSESALETGDFSLVLANGYLYKVIGNTALDISAQTGMKWIRVAKNIGGTWYIGGQPGPDVYKTDWPNSLVKYDGTTFTNLSSLVKNHGVFDLDGPAGDMIVKSDALYRFDGQQAKKLTIMKIGESAPVAGSIDWNGKDWVTGNFLGGKNDTTGLFRFSSNQDPKALSIFTSSRLGLSFRYPSIWDRVYRLSSLPDLYGFFLPGYKSVTYNLLFQRGTEGLYNNRTMLRGLANGWSAYTRSFVTWHRAKYPDYTKSFGSEKLISQSTTSFPVSGLNAAKVVFVTKIINNLDSRHPNQKYIHRDEFILLATKNLKKTYIFELSQTQAGWTLSSNYYAAKFEDLVRTVRALP